METTAQTLSQVSNHIVIMLRFKNQCQIAFVEIKGVKEDVFEVVFASLIVSAVSAAIAAASFKRIRLHTHGIVVSKAFLGSES